MGKKRPGVKPGCHACVPSEPVHARVHHTTSVRENGQCLC